MEHWLRRAKHEIYSSISTIKDSRKSLNTGIYIRSFNMGTTLTSMSKVIYSELANRNGRAKRTRERRQIDPCAG
jgi:hypothetical protein